MPYKYTTLDPNHKTPSAVLSVNLLGFLSSPSYADGVFSTTNLAYGKWYFEVTFNSNDLIVGIVPKNFQLGVNLIVDANTNNGYFIDGTSRIFGGGLNSYNSNNKIAESFLGKTVGLELDFDNGSITYIVDNIRYESYSDLQFNGDFNIYLGKSTATANGVVNFGQTPFINNYSEGFKPYGAVGQGLVLKNPTTNQNYSLADKTLILLPDESDETIVEYGIEVGKEIKLDEDFNKIKTVNIDGTFTEETVVPFSVYDYISETPEMVIYNESENSLSVSTTVEPYSVYDYISENPQAIVYTESTDDISVSTTTEPYDLYDEFGDELEVLYYTDDEAVTEADLILDANWSPIDELEGDFEVVTWSDNESVETFNLEMSSVPTPQFVYSDTVTDISNGFNKILIIDQSTPSDYNETKFLLTPNNTNWFKWNGTGFSEVSVATNQDIRDNGMTAATINSLTIDQLKLWTYSSINIGVFLEDDIRGNYTSKIESLGVDTVVNSGTSTISDIKFYILNTTAEINIGLHGLTLIGTVSDADMTRVQYRVILNDEPYYPANGDFTPLSQPPLNIDLTLRTDEIKIGDWNTLVVEFQDYFGTTDSWEVQFLGEYAGLMFSDIAGDYYSTDLGQVLKYLDFGTILTGQVTPYQEVKLTNKYGFNLKDVKVMVNTLDFANGLEVDLDHTLGDSVEPTKELLIGEMINGDEYNFNIRLRSDPETIPNGNTDFDIVAMGMRDV